MWRRGVRVAFWDLLFCFLLTADMLHARVRFFAHGPRLHSLPAGFGRSGQFVLSYFCPFFVV